jgi:leucyl aminopeptidase
MRLNFSRFGLASSVNGTKFPLHLATPDTLDVSLRGDASEGFSIRRQWSRNTGFSGDALDLEWAERKNGKGELCEVYVAAQSHDDEISNPLDYMYALSGYAQQLSPGTYKLAGKLNRTPEQAYNLLLGWGLGAYNFPKKGEDFSNPTRKLYVPKGKNGLSEDNLDRLHCELSATYLVQDWINEPPNFLTPQELANRLINLSHQFNATCKVISGTDLEKEFPMVHTVGKGATKPECQPRMVEMRWGDPAHPAVTLVGKGVTFDSGGVISKGEGMRHMKYDMAGAAHVAGLAMMIMRRNLPVNLRMLVPIVENTGGPQAYKLDEVYTMRSGDTVEITHTDAEGRLIVADAVCAAAEEEADIYSFGTMGWFGHFNYPGFGIIYSDKRGRMRDIWRASMETQEYLEPRGRRLIVPRLSKELENSPVAKRLQSVEDHQRADDLYMYGFIRSQAKGRKYTHLDIQPFREKNTVMTEYPPGLPTGGFAQGVRTVFWHLEKKYGNGKVADQAPEPS